MVNPKSEPPRKNFCLHNRSCPRCGSQTKWNMHSTRVYGLQLQPYARVGRSSLGYIPFSFESAESEGQTDGACSDVPVKISQVIYLSNLNIYSNFNPFSFLS